MYESYTRQALPSKEYRELLGSAVCVFNSNNSFIIENILKLDNGNKYDWYKLIDLESGKLEPTVKKIVSSEYGEEIELCFSKLVRMRNRIIHSFQITDSNGEQILATKEKNGNKQFVITKEYLVKFIQLNEKLSDLLHELRGY